jgi:hypothetical protein
MTKNLVYTNSGTALNDPVTIAAALAQLQQYGITPTILQTSADYNALAKMFMPPPGGLSYLRSPWKGRPRLVIGEYGKESWPRKFGQGDKWEICSLAA